MCIGAGTILDSLRAKKRLVVVVNEKLMGNHQHEIADAMAEKNYLLKATPETVCSVLKQLPETVFTPYPLRGVSFVVILMLSLSCFRPF